MRLSDQDVEDIQSKINARTDTQLFYDTEAIEMDLVEADDQGDESEQDRLSEILDLANAELVKRGLVQVYDPATDEWK